MPTASKITRYLAFDPQLNPLYRDYTIGPGKLGGKARGFLFAKQILRQSNDPLFNRIIVPKTYYIATGVFADFVAQNQLERIVESGRDYDQIKDAFINGAFDRAIRSQLAQLIGDFSSPLAIRSSSLLEDNLRYSFAGKYETIFMANKGSQAERQAKLEQAIKLVFASIYCPNAVEYRRKHGLRGDKMAVMIQQLTGKQRGVFFYPEISGVAFSKNYRRWTNEVRKEDGILRLVFGLGTRCVGREYARTFSLTDLSLRPEGYAPWSVAKYSQERFDVLDLAADQVQVININQHPDAAKYHPYFSHYTQLYNTENEQITDLNSKGLYQLSPADKIVFTFQQFPQLHPEFFQLVNTLVNTLEKELGLPVDIEFAYEPEEKLLTLVQMRPLPSYEEYRAVQIPANLRPETILLCGNRMLATGILLGIKRLVYVDPYLYKQATNKAAVAREIERINRSLEGEQYILVGPGRWGSTKAELGVPISYNQISNAGLIVELGIKAANFVPELPYGTRFFHDLEVDGILYLSVFDNIPGNVFYSDWLNSQAGMAEPTGHPAVSVYTGLFNVYLDGERRIGCVTAHC
ncbi:MAG: phosphoenolpyruvate synthase [Firmicutes bacterium]|nr:phosphoenolpyruvate synthase [Bacillota bacterium]